MMQRHDLVVATALRLEALVVRAALPGTRLVRSGMGPKRARAAAGRWAATAFTAGPAGPGGPRPPALAVAGVCAGLDPLLRPGDVVVASELRGPDGVLPCRSADLLVAALARRGLQAHLGPLVSTDHLVRGGERARLHAEGAIAADMESAFLAAAAGLTPAHPTPLAVLRVVADSPGHELARPGAVAAGLRALRVLRRAAPALADWGLSVMAPHGTATVSDHGARPYSRDPVGVPDGGARGGAASGSPPNGNPAAGAAETMPLTIPKEVG
jgi:4-hydroxy-3-methylbut-2-en-1-yl diphosphate reductase